MERHAVLANWHATFRDLRLADVPLQEWLAFHAARREANRG